MHISRHNTSFIDLVVPDEPVLYVVRGSARDAADACRESWRTRYRAEARRAQVLPMVIGLALSAVLSGVALAVALSGSGHAMLVLPVALIALLIVVLRSESVRTARPVPPETLLAIPHPDPHLTGVITEAVRDRVELLVDVGRAAEARSMLSEQVVCERDSSLASADV